MYELDDTDKSIYIDYPKTTKQLLGEDQEPPVYTYEPRALPE